MNSLAYIRNHCNLSQSFLAELLGVSRQSIYLWENERKELPAKRRQQLSELFGLEEKFFGEIKELNLKELFQKKAYLHSFNGKAYYCFVAHENAVYGEKHPIYLKNPDAIASEIQLPISFNDKLELCKKELKNLIDAIQTLSEEADDDPAVQSMITHRNRIGRTFSGLVCSVQQIAKKPVAQKMIYWHTLWDTITAICLAYGGIEADDLEQKNGTLDTPYSTSTDWIVALAKTIQKRNEDGAER